MANSSAVLGVQSSDMGIFNSPSWPGLSNYEVVENIGVSDVERVFDFDLLRCPTAFVAPDGSTVEIPGKTSIVNSRTMQSVGDHSDKYGENQPRNTMPELATVLVEAGFEIVSTGTLKGGAKMYLSAKMPEGFSFDFNGTEVIDHILNIGDAVDGSSRFRIVQALHRISCTNTFSANLVGVQPIVAVKHTRSGQIEVEAIGAALDAALKEQQAINDAIERLIETTYTEGQFMEMVRHESVLGPQPTEDGNLKTRWGNEFDKIVESYKLPNLDGIRNTKFGAVQAIQFYETNARSVRGSKGMTAEQVRPLRNIESLVFKSQEMSENAARLVMAS